RREFVKQSVATLGTMGTLGSATAPADAAPPAVPRRTEEPSPAPRAFNGPYTGEHLHHVAFPLGGIGAGMVCLEGTGALSHVSLRHKPDVFNEPAIFAAVCVKRRGKPNIARVLEGPVPDWKKFGSPGSGNGSGGSTYGLPRFREATF